MTDLANVSTSATTPTPPDRTGTGLRARRASPTSAWVALLLVAIAALGVVASTASASGPQDGEAAPVVASIPPGYRDWKLITVAHEEGDLKDIRAVLGNDAAIAAYRQGRSQFPDGAIIARLAWQHVPSKENNEVFGREQSFVAGAATNVQFMVRDSRRYAKTGGWGYGQFDDGKPVAAAMLSSCAACHAKTPNGVFARYSP